MTPYSRHKQEMTATLENLLKRTPNASKVTYRNKAVAYVLKAHFSSLGGIKTDDLEKVLKSATFVENKLKKLTK